tara:strand:- start:3350 stop:4609 length:1260 start_codon:yes stop_codon:yes gene_type:complete
MAKYELVLPKMGESVEEATIISWLKNIGDKISADDLIVEIATDKVDSEVPCEVSGVLTKQLFKVNDIVKVGEPLAIIETNEAKIEQTESEEIYSETFKETETLVTKASEIIDYPKLTNNDKFYSPLVKNIAKKEGITNEELDKIKGSGKDSRITKKDLMDYMSNKKYTEFDDSLDPVIKYEKIGKDSVSEMTRKEKLISDHMTKSKNESAHVQSFIEADITKIWEWREKNKKLFFERENEKITFTPIFVMLVAQTLKQFPLLNASIEGETVIRKNNINIGMATALGDGSLIVPVIKNADRLSLIGLVKKVNDLANRARSSKLDPDDIKDGTYTISNVGVFDTMMGTPLINQPQLGILAFGSIRKEPSVIETEKGDFIGIRNKIMLSHSYDHRIINGAMGGMFIKKIKELIENWDSNLQL